MVPPCSTGYAWLSPSLHRIHAVLPLQADQTLVLVLGLPSKETLADTYEVGAELGPGGLTAGRDVLQ